MKQRKKNTNKLKKCTYYIDGMHCAACEVTIEKTILKKQSVKIVDASLEKGQVDFEYLGSKPSPEELSELLKDAGYKFSEKRVGVGDRPLFQKEGSKLVINKEKLTRISVSVGLVILIFILLIFVQNSQFASKVVLNDSSPYISFFLFGILAGLSSCAALVGGLLLSLSKQWTELYLTADSNLERYQPYTMFNIGRIVSFVILGGLLGQLGSYFGISLSRTPVITASVVIVVSIFMLILGLQMLGVKWAYKLKIGLPKFLTRTVSTEENFKGKYMPFLVGAMTFFLPCGFTIIAQGLALTSGSFLRGSMMMFAFALGTLPVLITIGLTSVNLTKKPRLNAVFSIVSGILVVVFALYNINSQFNVLGFKSLSDINLLKTTSEQDQTAVIDTDGKQVIKIIAKDFTYAPQGSTTLKADKPAKLVIDNQGIEGCGVYLSATGLTDKYLYLKNGLNVVDIPNPKVGNYKITCSMGMVPPVSVKVI